MSSGLCKNLEGTIFPLQIETLKDRVDDAVDTGHVNKAHHGSSSASDFHETTLDHVDSTQLPPQPPRQREEGEQFGQVLLQAAHPRTIVATPASLDTDPAAGPPIPPGS